MKKLTTYKWFTALVASRLFGIRQVILVSYIIWMKNIIYYKIGNSKQELVFIGKNMNKDLIKSKLSACLADYKIE